MMGIPRKLTLRVPVGMETDVAAPRQEKSCGITVGQLETKSAPGRV